MNYLKLVLSEGANFIHNILSGLRPPLLLRKGDTPVSRTGDVPNLAKSGGVESPSASPIFSFG